MAQAVFPLIPRRRVIGLAFGGVRSARRGVGSDVASSREYRPGDDVGWIDWAASARLSAARADDEFIVRERFADEAPRVIVVCDRRPSLGIGASPLRTLDKPRALLTAIELIGASATAARSLTGYVDFATGEPYWRPPRTEHRAEPHAFERPFRAPADTVSRALEHLGEHRRDLPTQTFVFVLSDFLVPPDERDLAAHARAPLGARAGGRAGPGMGADVPRRRRRLRPVRRSAQRAGRPVFLTRAEAARLRDRNEDALGRPRAHASARSGSSRSSSTTTSRPRCSAPSSAGPTCACSRAGWWRESGGCWSPPRPRSPRRRRRRRRCRRCPPGPPSATASRSRPTRR